MPDFHALLKNVRASIDEITPLEARDLLGSDYVFLDVREREEYQQGTIPASMFIPRGSLELEVGSRLPGTEVPIIVYCAAGIRSAFAARTLLEMGYSQVYSLAGGFNRWKELGFPWIEPRTLSGDQLIRYNRQILLNEIGEAGQRRLLESKVMILGAGGLGSPAALYLGAAGIGTLGIADMDDVDITNLQRQVIHSVATVGRPKVDSAKAAIEALNPEVVVRAHHGLISSANVEELIAGYDLVVDATDNFATRYIVNDASLSLEIPVVHGSIFRFEGVVTVFSPKIGPCYRCLVPEEPPPELAPACNQAGVLGVLPGIIGSMQALEALKMLLGIGEPLIGELLTFDALESRFTRIHLPKNPDCHACS